MRLKFLSLLLLLTISALLSVNVRYAYAQHHTINFVIDPCTLCAINIRNGTGLGGTVNHNYTNGQSAIFEDGHYNITAYSNSAYTFFNWTATAGITVQNHLASSTNITLSGTAPSTLTAKFNPPVTTIQPVPILFVALLTTTLSVLLRRTRRLSVPA